MRDLLNLMESSMAPNVLYHGTYQSNLESIMAHGLMWEKSQSSIDAVFLAIDTYTAVNYSNHHSDRPQDEWVILAVDTAKLNWNNLQPDNYELADMLEHLDDDDPCAGKRWDECTWLESLRICGQCAYHDSIRPSALSVVTNA